MGWPAAVRETTPALASTYEQAESVTSAMNAGVSIDYPDAVDVSVSTLIASLADATTEATRRAAWSAVPRTVFELSAFAAPFNLDLGQTVTITHPRYFTAGSTAVITRLSDDLLADTCTLEVIR
ncbi:MAG: hypothetical protein U5L02_16595 [Rheinheimera sp.]|nr:hypothetical protein [Rheinheimera sp.]